MTRYEIGFIKRAEELGYDGEALLEKAALFNRARKAFTAGSRKNKLINRLAERYNGEIAGLLSTDEKLALKHPMVYMGTQDGSIRFHDLDRYDTSVWHRVKKILSQLQQREIDAANEFSKTPSFKRVSKVVGADNLESAMRRKVKHVGKQDVPDLVAEAWRDFPVGPKPSLG